LCQLLSKKSCAKTQNRVKYGWRLFVRQLSVI
jgi:hypothetical protein